MSRQRQRIEKRAKELGIEIVVLEWDPVSKGTEKSGPDGGWYLEDKDGNVYLGCNVDELIQDMEIREGRKKGRKRC